MQALKAAGSVFLGIAAFLALLFLMALWISGVHWVSEKIVWYVWTGANIALWVCLLVLLPLSLLPVTRKVSCFGIIGSSFIFGLCTWILGFLTTYEYWGGIGVFVGLVSGIVGIVPVGILASLFHADWTSAIFLMIGLVLTYGARSFAIWLAIKTDQEESGLAARVDTISTGDGGTKLGSGLETVWVFLRSKGYQLTRYADDWVITCMSIAVLAVCVLFAVGPLLSTSDFSTSDFSTSESKRTPVQQTGQLKPPASERGMATVKKIKSAGELWPWVEDTVWVIQRWPPGATQAEYSGGYLTEPDCEWATVQMTKEGRKNCVKLVNPCWKTNSCAKKDNKPSYPQQTERRQR